MAVEVPGRDAPDASAAQAADLFAALSQHEAERTEEALPFRRVLFRSEGDAFVVAELPAEDASEVLHDVTVLRSGHHVGVVGDDDHPLAGVQRAHLAPGGGVRPVPVVIREAEVPPGEAPAGERGRELELREAGEAVDPCDRKVEAEVRQEDFQRHAEDRFGRKAPDAHGVAGFRTLHADQFVHAERILLGVGDFGRGARRVEVGAQARGVEAGGADGVRPEGRLERFFDVVEMELVFDLFRAAAEDCAQE